MQKLQKCLHFSSKKIKNFQEVTGTFLCYAKAVDPIMLTLLGSISTQQENPTDQTMQKVKQVLDYTATHTYAIITYHTSVMVLSYMSETKARSRTDRNLFMSVNVLLSPKNGTVLNITKIIKAIMLSETEVELGELFINCK